MEEVLIHVNYLIREKLWGSVRVFCDKELNKGQDAILTFWKAYGIFNEGSVTEAIRELTRVQDRREVSFAAAVALIYYHQRCRHVDQEAVDTFELQLDEREEMASDKDLICTATFLWHTNQLKRAGQIVQKLIDSNSNNSTQAQCIKGWIYLSSSKEELQQKSLQFFDHVIDLNERNGKKSLEAMLGKVKVFEKAKKYESAVQLLSEASVCYPNFKPAIIEKSKIHIANNEWDQAHDAVQQVLISERQNIEGLRIYVFYLMARENDWDLVQEKLTELLNSMKAQESKNSDLYFNISRLFARYCGRNPIMLQRTLQILDIAIMLSPENAAYHSEVGHQKALLGDYVGAYNVYQKATQFDDTNLTPLYGMIFCRIKQDMVDDAQGQLEFLSELVGDNGDGEHQKTAEHCFLEALVEWRKKGNKTEAIRLLDNCLNLHIQQTKLASNNIDFYIRLNADFLMQLAQEYLVHCGVKPKITSAGPPKHLIKAIKLLENVTKQNSALAEAQVLLAKAKWLNNDTPGALRELQDCLQKNPTVVEAYIMAALINSEAGNMKAADNFLKQAFAQDFSIRENCSFMLMKSEVEITGKNWPEALATLEHAFRLPAVVDPQSVNTGDPSKRSKLSLPFGQEERARVFLNLVQVQCELKMFDQAKKVLTRAVAEFANTPEEVRVMLAQSDLALKMGDTKKALNMLKKIQPSDRSFVQAKKKQAQIYLDEIKDRNNYTRCYLEILDAKSSVENFKMVAQALMDIQEPEEAIQYYERALERQSEDTNLVREVGKALVMTHDYNRAVKYYETRLAEDPKLLDLRTDLANLYWRLKAYDQSKRVLIEALKYLKTQENSYEVKSKNVTYLVLMAKVCLESDMQYPGWKLKDNLDAKQGLIEARSLQAEVIEMCRASNTDRLDEERELSGEISCRLGQYLEEREGNYEDAIIAYNDCLSRKADHIEAQLSLAKLFQSTGNNEQCLVYCNRILKQDATNEQATFMVANLMLMKQQTDAAIKTYIQLLEKSPDNFNTLSQLIELLRRAGRMNELSVYLTAAEKACRRSNMAGLAFCKGLSHFYQNSPSEALKELNVARYDNFFGTLASCTMIEIYLNPANEMMFTCISDQQGSDQQYSTTASNIAVARELIEELAGKGVDTTILECSALIASQDGKSLELAEKQLKSLLQKNKEYVPALVVMGLCKFMQKKQSDARNYLKTVISHEFQLENAHYFERAWLMMADYWISANNFEQAEIELAKVLKYNKSNVKACEYMGLIKEKERDHINAAKHYLTAFQMSNNKNAGVGYRLAFNYMKAQRYTDTIDVGKKILAVYPEFPRLKDDLINKARVNVRS